MCNQRDRLIGYIYNEGTAAEIGEVQRHLDECHECRAEVAGLRSVREDLLAWDVPSHESVWRPFAPAPVTPWWRLVPAWAMATAAGVVMLSGAAGGAVVHAVLPGAAQVVATRTDAPTGGQSVQVSITPADLSALEQRLTARFADQVGAVDARVQQVSTRSQTMVGAEGDHAALASEIVRLREENRKLAGIVGTLAVDLDAAKRTADFKIGDLQVKFSNQQALMGQLVQVK